MSQQLNTSKSYGVLHTENYFSFLGFSKKVNSDEIQKIDIYLDDKLIDTITADKHIEKIEDIYELTGFGFDYTLPDKYVGQKSVISFKNHETKEHLQNSPYVLIDKRNHKYNEYKFLHSLSLPIDEEKIKDVYCPNNIGFLATEENLEDKDFIEYINQIMQDFQNCTFKALIFNKTLNSTILNHFHTKNLQIVKICNIYEIFTNIEIYLSNYEKTYENKYENTIVELIRKYSSNVMCIGLGLNQKNISMYQKEVKDLFYYQKFFDNLEYFGFDNNDIIKYGKAYHEIYFKKASEQYEVDIGFNMNETISKAYVYWNLKLGLSNHEFFKYSLEFARKFAKLQ